MGDDAKTSKGDAPFIEALRNYKQADEDGVMVRVSRQAIEETLTSHQALIDALRDIEYHYENQDMNHIDFRVFAKQRALAALASVSP